MTPVVFVLVICTAVDACDTFVSKPMSLAECAGFVNDVIDGVSKLENKKIGTNVACAPASSPRPK